MSIEQDHNSGEELDLSTGESGALLVVFLSRFSCR